MPRSMSSVARTEAPELPIPARVTQWFGQSPFWTIWQCAAFATLLENLYFAVDVAVDVRVGSHFA
jgi:hypothetical protein